MTNHAYQLQQSNLLESIATASNNKEQRILLDLALLAIDEQKDDQALDHPNVVYQVQCIILVVRSLQKAFHHEAPVDILNSFGRLLLILLRNRRSAVQAFIQVGFDLCNLLFSIWCQDDDTSLNISVRSLFNRISKLDIALIETRRKELLLRLIHRIFRDGDIPLQELGCQLLCGFSNHRESRPFMMNGPGFVDDVIRMAISRPRCTPIQVFVCGTLENLSKDIRSKSELARTKGLLMMLLRNCKHSEATVRLHAVGALSALLINTNVRCLFLKRGKGLIVQRVIEATDDPILRETALQALLRLIGPQTLDILMKRRQDLCERLTSRALSLANRQCHDHAVAVLAAQCLRKLVSHITVRDALHPTMVESLLILAVSPSSQVRFWIVKALVAQSEMIASSFFMARTQSMIDALLRLSSDPNLAVKEGAMRVFLNLMLDVSNARRLVMLSAVIMAVIDNAKQVQHSTGANRTAIKAILAMAQHQAIRERVAKQLDLVESLATYGVARNADAEMKKAALQGVIALAPLM